jgi:hypothetical protein
MEGLETYPTQKGFEFEKVGWNSYKFLKELTV